jgi:hypothetical protein
MQLMLSPSDFDVLQDSQGNSASWRKTAQHVMALLAPKDFPVNVDE